MCVLVVLHKKRKENLRKTLAISNKLSSRVYHWVLIHIFFS